ncbi:hypothetical protein D9615_004779 [Tricholomella constricta]|uniref:Tyr recombinase domain-containing protein n=1 Tax=Tricholomella constricta TaxID=117010 RepID=A0A8H5HI14_9AGAR|nr:hypothetical protein D9615_004779 [Tricholomella constricta]
MERHRTTGVRAPPRTHRLGVVNVNPKGADVLGRPPGMSRLLRATRARFLAPAQARTAYPPVRYALGAIVTRSASVHPRPFGMEHPRDAGETSGDVLSVRKASSCAPIGSDLRAAPAPARVTSTSAPGAGERLMELRRVLARRKCSALCPYDPDAWEHLLHVHNLLGKYPLLPQSLRTGFDAGIPPIAVTHTPDNGPSIKIYPQAYLDIIEKEFRSERYIGPLSRTEVEALIGPFQSSPLSLVPKPGKPNKFRAVHNFSFPRAASATFHSINYHINSDLYPCTWGTFPTVCTTIWNLPPESQASIRDVAEAYRSIPIEPNQWPGLVVKLRDSDSFAINTNDNFGLASAGGVYGLVSDAGADIFRAEGIGPISKWVDDHIFFRILRTHIHQYNAQRAKWHAVITDNGGRLQDRSRIWYRGETMPNGLPMEFDEDLSYPVRDLSNSSPRSTLDAAYSYASADIDRVSETLGIPWEPTKTVEFDHHVQYLGLAWDLQEQSVSLPSAKKEKYLRAIQEWESQCTHTQEATQKLYGKLLHASLIIPAGRAYLTRLETMLGTFHGRPFTPHHAPTGTADDLGWWSRTLKHPCITRRIPGPIVLVDRQAFSDASSGVGIGITVGNRWRAWRLIPGWSGEGRDIGWAEAVGFELLICTLLTVSSEGDELQVFGDNRGVVEGWWKGRSRNRPTNEVFKRIHARLANHACVIHSRYVPSRLNPAGKPSYTPFPSPTSLITSRQGGYTMSGVSSSLPYPFPPRSSPSSLTSMHLSTHARYVIEYAVTSRLPSQNQPSMPPPEQSGSTSGNSSRPQATPSFPVRQTGKGGQLIHSRYVALPRTVRLGAPAAYHPSLTPRPSPLRPHCFAGDRLRLWQPSTRAVAPNFIDIERVVATLALGYADGTKESYGSGLLAWHVWCDAKGVPEGDRAPSSQILISAFISSLTGAFAGRTIRNYVYGIRAWHVVHSIPWRPDNDELDLMLKAADRLTPASSKRKKRQPYTVDFIRRLWEQMTPDDPFDTAVFACLVCLFYSASRVGEFTVRRLNAFDPAVHPSVRSLRRDQDREGRQVTILQIPRTKTSVDGEEVYWSAQNGPTDPEAAMERHLALNQPPEDHHLFAYKHKDGYRPLTKTAFVKRLATLARSAGLDPLQGHGIRIGATLEYLLRGVSFEAMKAMGRWQSDAFTLYLRKHALILAPYIQAQAPQVYDDFVRITMPAGVR